MAIEDRERRVAEAFSATDREELVRIYARWAERYDEDMLALGMRGPEIVAAMAARHLPDRASPILDAGAGSGRVGDLLSILGYSDLSDAMLAQARALGVYRKLREGVLGEPLGFRDQEFVAIVAAGVFTAGHAPPESFDELLRVTRPNGVMIFTIAEQAFERGGFRDKLEALERGGRCRLIDATRPFRGLSASIAYREHRGRVLVYGVAP
jgi:SAM-dependent methyltransferase